MEVDRKKPNEEYHIKNLALCCYWCNNAKTDEFSEEDFKVIGSVIRIVWNKRLKKFGIDLIPVQVIDDKLTI